MNFFGIVLGIATLFTIGLGFFWVIRGEYYFGYLWWPYVMGLGFAVIGLSVFIAADWLSALIGVFGTSLIWGSTELRDQAVRAELGWYRFNPHKRQPPLAQWIKRWPTPKL
ncbi:MAG: DUF4491 family protein [Thermoflexales bacterium]|nr:DUF4491 family protein [Thermoflexales bacterium]